MWKIFISVLLVLCTACAKDHHKPVAQLTYTDFVSIGNGLYDLEFRSDIDLLNLFQRGEGFIGGMMHCALSDDTDFSIEHVLQQSGYGSIESGAHGSSDQGFEFVATISFRETFNEGRSSRSITEAELRALLSGKATIPCKYVATIYGFKPYYSGTLMVPVRDVFRELDRSKGAE